MPCVATQGSGLEVSIAQRQSRCLTVSETRVDHVGCLQELPPPVSPKSHYFVRVKGGAEPSVAGKLLVYLYCKGKIVPSYCMVILLQTTLCEMGLYISKLQVLFSHCSISTLSR